MEVHTWLEKRHAVTVAVVTFRRPYEKHAVLSLETAGTQCLAHAVRAPVSAALSGESSQRAF